MTQRLDGKAVLLTAAGAGIGRASAIALADAGGRVFATDVDMEALATLKAERPAIETFRLDVLAAGDVAQARERVGPPDVLFNCAGYVHHGTILETDEEAWAHSFALNVRSQYRMIRAFLPLMIANGGGSIINMSSVASSIKGVANRAVYSATKAAVLGLTKSVAKDFIGEGIRCNAICPGTVLTPSLEARMRAGGDYEAAKADFLARQPKGRFTTPEEVATLVVYLASDDSAIITGQAHIIDDGWSL